VQQRKDRVTDVFRCQVVESIMSQYCGMWSAAGVVRYLKFREPKNVDPAACRRARETGRLAVDGRIFNVTLGAWTSSTYFRTGDLDSGSTCHESNLHVDGVRYEHQTAQSVLEMRVWEESARVNDMAGTITLVSGLQARLTDLSFMDSMEGTGVWSHETHTCPEGIVQLYLGPVKIFSNSSDTLEGGTAVIEDLVKEQVAGLQLDTLMVLCGNAALQTHLRGIVLFVHPATGIEVAKGKFDSLVADADIRRIE
ncbi:MAG: hypothetical protein AN484_27315, partial [Aphanizomenon flos-aquae WA102]